MSQTPKALVLRFVVGLLVGGAVFAASSVFHEPVPHTVNFGKLYQTISADPFDFPGIFPHRILMPLTAWAVGLGGQDFWLFHHACSVLFLALLFCFCRAKGSSILDASLITVTIGFSAVVQTYKFHVGYPDLVTYGLLLLSLMALRRDGWFWLTVALNVFNHDQFLFYVPWLLILRWQTVGWRWRAELVGGVTTLAAYAAWRVYINSALTPAQVADQLTPSWYWERLYFPLGTVGLSALAVVASVVQLGPLLILIFWGIARGVRGSDGLSMLVLAGVLVAIFAIAHDVNRFVNILFVPIVFASIQCTQTLRGRAAFAFLSAAMIVSYTLLNTPVLERLQTTSLECLIMQDMSRMTTCVIPKLWWLFAAGGTAMLACAVIGFWWGRSSLPPRPPEPTASSISRKRQPA